eukprot:13637860-Alexandrium_andersonii.AAC.1
MPQSLYGSPASPVSRVGLRNLTAAIATTLDTGAATNRSQVLAHMTTAPNSTDPAVHVLLMRVRAVRRTWHMFPHLRQAMEASLAHYQGIGHPGCAGCDMWLADAHDAEPKRIILEHMESQESGPIGLLLNSLAWFGLQIAQGWTIGSGHGRRDLWHMPHQQVRPWILDLCRRFRLAELCKSDRFRGDVQPDPLLTAQCVGKANAKHQTLIRRALMAGIWTQSNMKHVDAGVGGDGCCLWCGAPCDDATHRFWTCE